MKIIADTQPIVVAQGITRDYVSRGGTVHALRGIDLQVVPGELVALRGRSGSGKTTLLNILTGIDRPTAGQVSVLGQDLIALNDTQRTRLRREAIGILFQSAHLFPLLTAQENVAIPLLLSQTPYPQRVRMIQAALERVGLSERAHHRSMELSGGEQQRVALARAIVHQPRFMVADEPTGNLDPATSHHIIQMLVTIARETSMGLLIATHDPHMVDAASQVLWIHDGHIIR